MTPGELVAVITDADAVEPRGRRRVIVELNVPTLMGFKGKYLGHENVIGPDGEPIERAVYGYTRRDCLRMRDAIYVAARQDSATVVGDLDDGFGDGA